MTQLPAAASPPDGQLWADYSTEITVDDCTVCMKVALARPNDVKTDHIVLGDRDLGPGADMLPPLRICSVYLRGDVRVCNHGTFTITCASPADADQYAANLRTLAANATRELQEQAKRLDASRADAPEGQPAPHPVPIPVADDAELAALCEMGMSRSDAACIQLALDGLYLVNLGELKHAAKHAPTERGTRLRALPVLAQCAEHLQRIVREDAAFNSPKS